MFIEYEIKKKDEVYSSILNTDHIVIIEASDEEFFIRISSGDVRFFLGQDGNWSIYDAFKRALCGESVTIEGIGYVRPLKPIEIPIKPSIDPVKAITWRDYA